MTTREVARYLRLKERTVYELVRGRQIPSVRVAGKWMFPRELVDRWLAENTDDSALGARAPATPAVLAGSHDPLLQWAVRESGCGLASLCNGSEDGLRRVAARDAMVAAIHLVDPASGAYNVAEFDALPDRRSLVLLRWARRRQGLVVAAGNPLGLTGLRDACGRAATLIARQPGAGSRRLLDWLLRRDGVAQSEVRWADGCAGSESEVAEAVAEGRADAGVAIEAVAHQHRLGFVALHEESVDLLARRFDCFEPPLQRLLRFCAGEAFAQRAASLPGYDVSGLGSVVRNG